MELLVWHSCRTTWTGARGQGVIQLPEPESKEKRNGHLPFRVWRRGHPHWLVFGVWPWGLSRHATMRQEGRGLSRARLTALLPAVSHCHHHHHPRPPGKPRDGKQTRPLGWLHGQIPCTASWKGHLGHWRLTVSLLGDVLRL